MSKKLLPWIAKNTFDVLVYLYIMIISYNRHVIY
ncbi:hypothetical protein Anamo_1696 [Acetomicrobium mobile DSM 13181]|uniref:Uncharacterized protein n=1 Tax=Acetomicrobium mobile (strain ATCC BAA-54 / DSM 13181 / JCM 12221 / NGA) TaxID=891968 RepID=I4BYD3_ACEMN|nr:hypothetical protein Anamo_1696 [Acetomicrobium mobile DSM 13181]